MGRRLGWFVVCLVLVTFLAGADTAAGARWTVQSLPSPSVPSGQFSAISCPSARSSAWLSAVVRMGRWPSVSSEAVGRLLLLRAGLVPG